MPSKQKCCSWSAVCTVASRREAKMNGDCVFHMRYMTRARTVSPLTPAALAGDKQSQAIRATASCDRLVGLGSFPRGTGFAGLPKRTLSPFSLQLPLHPPRSWTLGGVLHPCGGSSCASPFPPSMGAALPLSPLGDQGNELSFPQHRRDRSGVLNRRVCPGILTEHTTSWDFLNTMPRSANIPGTGWRKVDYLSAGCRSSRAAGWDPWCHGPGGSRRGRARLALGWLMVKVQ